MTTEGFDKLAEVLAADPPEAEIPPKKKAKPRRAPPDRSRDHAVYAAPHRPPARSAPVFEADVRTVRRPRAELVNAGPPRRGPPLAAVAIAVVAAVMSFGIATLAQLAL